MLMVYEVLYELYIPVVHGIHPLLTSLDLSTFSANRHVGLQNLQLAPGGDYEIYMEGSIRRVWCSQ